jgi:hypothetical protein
VTFPAAGDWLLEVIVEVADGQAVLLSSTVPVP